MERFSSQFGEVELTDEREFHIWQFHPDVRSYRKYFAEVITKPELIRRSKYDQQVFILSKLIDKNKHLAIVIKTNKRNFILTAYLTSKIEYKA